MKLTFEEPVIAKIKPRLTDGKKLLLTFEDGVGKYSQHAMLHMQTQFTINIVAADADLTDYDQHLDSNLGPVYIKGYSSEDLQQQMTIKLRVAQNTLQLSGEGGMIDDNLGFIDFTDPDSIKHNPAR